jgi:hypothetical protein
LPGAHFAEQAMLSIKTVYFCSFVPHPKPAE